MDAGVNWSGNIRYAARELHRPQSIEELRRIVASSRGLRALGSRHSFSAIADTTGDLVDVTALPREIAIDEESQTVTVTAGTRYGELAPVIDRAGWALKNTGSLPHITIGGATATGTHGSGLRNGTLSSQVSSIEFVTVDSGLERISRGEEGFDGAVVHLGALGVATRLTIDLIPRFTVRQAAYPGVSWGDALENLDDLLAAAFSVSLFTKWTTDTFGMVWLKSTGELPEEVLGHRPLTEDIGLAGGPASAATVQRGIEGPWFERLPHFKLEFTPSNGDELQSEYFVPVERGREALEAVRAMAEELAPVLLLSEIRTIAADEQWLSGSAGRDSMALHFTWVPRESELRTVIRHLEERLLPLGARTHWGKVDVVTDVAPSYPHMDDFRALADTWDPRGKLRNRYLDDRIFS